MTFVLVVCHMTRTWLGPNVGLLVQFPETDYRTAYGPKNKQMDIHKMFAFFSLCFLKFQTLTHYRDWLLRYRKKCCVQKTLVVTQGMRRLRIDISWSCSCPTQDNTYSHLSRFSGHNISLSLCPLFSQMNSRVCKKKTLEMPKQLKNQTKKP